jgi:hypothetical protein
MSFLVEIVVIVKIKLMIINKIKRFMLQCGDSKGGFIKTDLVKKNKTKRIQVRSIYLAILCNSTAIEVHGDKNRISHGFKSCQSLNFIACNGTLPINKLNIDQ